MLDSLIDFSCSDLVHSKKKAFFLIFIITKKRKISKKFLYFYLKAKILEKIFILYFFIFHAATKHSQ